MAGTLQDRVALITGGGQGVGLGIAQAFAREGARVVITGRDEARLQRAAETLQALGAQVLVAVSDARRRADAVKAVAAAVDRFGRLDILVNNAQSNVPGVRLEEVDDDTWNLTVESGLYGTFYFMQAVFAQMKAQGGGKIINLGSRAGIEGSSGFAPYAATKEAIRAMSRVAAREWGKHNIQVNVICPAALSPAAIAYLKDRPEARDKYLQEIALGRFGDPERDIGRVAVFLASADSAYVTGQTINADGGQVML
jgi:NAD(P)-dependent dehydrogenase (short-subunit alcohol dehydrogenase family)